MIETIIQAWSANPTLFSLSILSIVATILLVVVVAKKSINVKWGDKTFDIGGKLNPETVEEITKKRVKTIMQMRYDLVFRQLKYAENVMEKVVHKMCDDYAHLLTKYAPPDCDIKSDYGYELYQMKVEKFIRCRLIAGLRKVYNENHIAEKSDLEWVAHKNHVVETARLDLMKFIDEEYYPCYGIKRDVIEAFHEDRWLYITTILMDILDNARIMSVRMASEIELIKQNNKIAVDE